MFLSSEHVFHPWSPSAWLRVSGDDALNFLQGQFTNDLRKSVAGAAVYGLWLNQKGKVMADSFVMPAEAAGTFWVGSYFSSATVIRERLEAYIIADDVTLADETAAWRGVTFFGAVDSAVLRQAVPGSVTFAGRRERGSTVEWVFPAAAWPQVQAMLADGSELSAAEVAQRRVEAGIPAVPADIGPGELPNEGGLEETAISYTKGCYLGQEVMARLKAMGQVRRRLMRVRGAGPAPAAGAALYQAGKKVGELRSAVATGDGFAGLALVSLLQLQPAVGLGLAPEGPATMTLAEAAA